MSMLNPYIIRRNLSVMIIMTLGVVAWHVGMTYYNLWYSIGFVLVAMILGSFINVLFINHPFRSVLEGQGILALDINSTGIITPFILKIKPPFMQGNLGGNKVMDIFDRTASFIMKHPFKSDKNTARPIAEGHNKGGIRLEYSEDEINARRFQLNHMPVFIYNSAVKSMLTKDFISNKEKDAFSEHTVLYLVKRTEELTSVTRDFARHVIEQIKPGRKLLTNKMFWIFIVIGLVILAMLFGPSLIATFTGTMETATDSLGGTIIPIGGG